MPLSVDTAKELRSCSCANQRHDAAAFREHPGNGQLRDRHAFLRRPHLQRVNETLISLAILPCEAREMRASRPVDSQRLWFQWGHHCVRHQLIDAHRKRAVAAKPSPVRTACNRPHRSINARLFGPASVGSVAASLRLVGMIPKSV